MTEIIAIATPCLMLLAWVIGFLSIYVIIPKQSIKQGLIDWWHEEDNII